MAFTALTNAKTIMGLGPDRSIPGTIIRPDLVLLKRKGGCDGEAIFDRLLPGAGASDYEELPLPGEGGVSESVGEPSKKKKSTSNGKVQKKKKKKEGGDADKVERIAKKRIVLRKRTLCTVNMKPMVVMAIRRAVLHGDPDNIIL